MAQINERHHYTNHKCIVIRDADGCEVENPQPQTYYISSKNRNKENTQHLEYLGSGQYHSVDVDGVTKPQSGDAHFWNLKQEA